MYKYIGYTWENKKSKDVQTSIDTMLEIQNDPKH